MGMFYIVLRARAPFSLERLANIVRSVSKNGLVHHSFESGKCRLSKLEQLDTSLKLELVEVIEKKKSESEIAERKAAKEPKRILLSLSGKSGLMQTVEMFARSVHLKGTPTSATVVRSVVLEKDTGDVIVTFDKIDGRDANTLFGQLKDLVDKYFGYNNIECVYRPSVMQTKAA